MSVSLQDCIPFYLQAWYDLGSSLSYIRLLKDSKMVPLMFRQTIFRRSNRHWQKPSRPNVSVSRIEGYFITVSCRGYALHLCVDVCVCVYDCVCACDGVRVCVCCSDLYLFFVTLWERFARFLYSIPNYIHTHRLTKTHMTDTVEFG